MRAKSPSHRIQKVLWLLFISASFLTFLPLEVSAQDQPSFTIQVVPSSGRVARGDGITATILISLSGEWDNKRIDLSATGLPPGAYAQFTPENVYTKETLSSTLTIGTSMSTPVGNHVIAIVAKAENIGEPQSAIYTLSVEEESDFSVNISPSREVVTRGVQTTAVITVTGSGGFSRPVQLSASGVPSGVDISLSPSTGTPPFESIITVRASQNADLGEHTITLTGVGGEKTHSIVYQLDVRATADETGAGDLSGKIILGAIAICLIAAAGFVAKS